MTINEIQEILDNIKYRPGWTFFLSYRTLDAPYLQVEFLAPPTPDKYVCEWQRGRKWMLSKYMTESEIVSTALKAVLTAEEHEAREFFTYKGVAVYNPHIDVKALFVAAERHERRK